MDKQTEITLGENRNSTAPTLGAILIKNRDVADLVAIREDALKQTKGTSFCTTVNADRFPDIERITHSLRKVQEIMAAAHLLWPNKKTARKISEDAVKIINHVYKKKFSFGSGKRFSCIVGGLFYLLGFRYDDPKKQREIAIVLQITDVSLRASYKKWLQDFPELFQDIKAMIKDQEFGSQYYHVRGWLSQNY